MKITVFGASGGTGLHLVKQACAAGHQVTAVVRDPARLSYTDPHLTTIAADVMNPDAIAPHIAGADAVVTAIGPRDLKPTTVQHDSAASIAAAMRARGVRRLVTVSNSGMFTEGDGPGLRLAKVFVRRILRHPWADQLAMEQVVRATGLDWTIVRPPRLTDGPRTGSYRSAVDHNLRNGRTVSRADVADCILRSLADASTVGSSIAIAN